MYITINGYFDNNPLIQIGMKQWEQYLLIVLSRKDMLLFF